MCVFLKCTRYIIFFVYNAFYIFSKSICPFRVLTKDWNKAAERTRDGEISPTLKEICGAIDLWMGVRGGDKGVLPTFVDWWLFMMLIVVDCCWLLLLLLLLRLFFVSKNEVRVERIEFARVDVIIMIQLPFCRWVHWDVSRFAKLAQVAFSWQQLLHAQRATNCWCRSVNLSLNTMTVRNPV